MIVLSLESHLNALEQLQTIVILFVVTSYGTLDSLLCKFPVAVRDSFIFIFFILLNFIVCSLHVPDKSLVIVPSCEF